MFTTFRRSLHLTMGVLATSLICGSFLAKGAVASAIDHRYEFPNGNTLVFVPGQPGLRLERNGRIIPFSGEAPKGKYAVHVFPSTDTNSGWSATSTPGSAHFAPVPAYLQDTPSFPVAVVETLTEDSRTTLDPIESGGGHTYYHYLRSLFAVTQDGKMTFLNNSEPTEARSVPNWVHHQYQLENKGVPYLVVLQPRPSVTTTERCFTLHVIRSDGKTLERFGTTLFTEAHELRPHFENGMLWLAPHEKPIDVEAGFRK